MKMDDELNDALREEYDFSQMVGGVRGKYAPDVAKIFPDTNSSTTPENGLTKQA